MAAEDEWNKQFEDDGITLGPEEALRGEIEKSKALKVERLKLRDEVEKLRAQSDSLSKKNLALERENEELRKKLSRTAHEVFEEPPIDRSPVPVAALFLLIFNLLAIGALIYFQTRK